MDRARSSITALRVLAVWLSAGRGRCVGDTLGCDIFHCSRIVAGIAARFTIPTFRYYQAERFTYFINILFGKTCQRLFIILFRTQSEVVQLWVHVFLLQLIQYPTMPYMCMAMIQNKLIMWFLTIVYILLLVLARRPPGDMSLDSGEHRNIWNRLVSVMMIVVSNLVMNIVEREPSGFRISVKQPIIQWHNVTLCYCASLQCISINLVTHLWPI